ncbi:MAG: tetratricopeptide repeat protein [Candidatus Cloacimonadales bacterium]
MNEKTQMDEIKQAELAERYLELTTKATAEWQKSQYNKAKIYAESALELAQKLRSERREAHAKHLLGTIYSYINTYDVAYDYHRQSMNIHKKLKMKKAEAEDWNNIGDINMKLGYYEKAKECFQTSLQLLPDFVRAWNNLGYLAARENENPQALEYYAKAAEIAKQTGKTRSYLISLINSTEVLNKSEKYAEAAELIAQSEKVLQSEELGTADELQIALLLNKAINADLQGKLPVAEKNYRRALELAEQCENQDYLLKVYGTMSNFYKEQELYKEAFQYLLKSQKISATLMNEKVVEKIMQIQNFYEKDKQQLTGLQLNEKTARLATMGVLTAGITHEINQPLCAIKLNLESIIYMLEKQSIDLPFDLNIELDQIMHGMVRIEEIVKHIRNFWNCGKDDKIQNTKVEATVQKVINLLERQIYSHGITIEYQFPEQPLFIQAASIHLEQILINLITNAINAFDKIKKKDKKIVIRAEQQASALAIYVRDNGPGIEPEHLENLFDPFYSSYSKPNNMGLGLAIVKYFVEHYDGVLQVESSLGEFTEFKILFEVGEEKK